MKKPAQKAFGRADKTNLYKIQNNCQYDKKDRDGDRKFYKPSFPRACLVLPKKGFRPAGDSAGKPRALARLQQNCHYKEQGAYNLDYSKND